MSGKGDIGIPKIKVNLLTSRFNIKVNLKINILVNIKVNIKEKINDNNKYNIKGIIQDDTRTTSSLTST